MDALFGDLPPPTQQKESRVSDLYADVPLEAKKLKRSSNASNDVALKKIKVINHDEKIFHFKSYIAERKGEREDMQDAAVLLDDCTSDYSSCNCGFPIERVSFHAVFDGHGGIRASRFAKENLHQYVKNNFPKDVVENFDRELKKRLIMAFKETDDAFIKEASKETPQWRDGSTASCVFTVNNILYAANIGDSKTILVRENEEGKSSIINLSKDHSPTLYEERQRIQKAGGFVKDGRVKGILEVSRAFGDARFKKYVIATPDIFKSTLTKKDRYLIIACDGLWKVFTVSDAVKFIDNVINNSSEQDIDTRYENACKEVANEAIRKGSSDNVTVVLLRIIL